MYVLKEIMVVIGLFAAGLFGGGAAGFAIGYVITGGEYRNPHGGALLAALLALVGALVGLIAGGIAASRREIKPSPKGGWERDPPIPLSPSHWRRITPPAERSVFHQFSFADSSQVKVSA
jgi:hypothetical protein